MRSHSQWSVSLGPSGTTYCGEKTCHCQVSFCRGKRRKELSADIGGETRLNRSPQPARHTGCPQTVNRLYMFKRRVNELLWFCVCGKLRRSRRGMKGLRGCREGHWRR